MKVFVFDPLWPQLLTAEHSQLFRKLDVEIILATKSAPLHDCKNLFSGTEPRVLAINPDYVHWALPAEDFKDIPQLKAIITASTSYGWIDTKFAAAQQIPVINIRNFSTDAVADWGVLMMLNLARKIPLLLKNDFPLNNGSDFQAYQGISLTEKKVGVIGFGHIGQAFAQRCHGLGMEVHYWNRSPKQTTYSFLELVSLFKECDVIFHCLADNEDTKAIITDDMLGTIKPEAIFLNIAEKNYNHKLLLERVANQTLFGYGFEDGPNCFNKYTGNVWAAPAYAWCTNHSLQNAMNAFVLAIANAAQGNFNDRVN